MDLPNSKDNLLELKEKLPNSIIIPISAYTRDNMNKLLTEIANQLENISLDAFEENDVDKVVEYVYTPKEDPFTIEVTDEGLFNVIGPEIKKLFEATDFEREESVKMFAYKLRKMGVDDKLRELCYKYENWFKNKYGRTIKMLR